MAGETGEKGADWVRKLKSWRSSADKIFSELERLDESTERKRLAARAY